MAPFIEKVEPMRSASGGANTTMKGGKDAFALQSPSQSGVLAEALKALLGPLRLDGGFEVSGIDEPRSVHACRIDDSAWREEVCYIRVQEAAQRPQKPERGVRIGGGYHIAEFKQATQKEIVEHTSSDCMISPEDADGAARLVEAAGIQAGATKYALLLESDEADRFAFGKVPPERMRYRGEAPCQYHFGSYTKGEARTSKGDRRELSGRSSFDQTVRPRTEGTFRVLSSEPRAWERAAAASLPEPSSSPEAAPSSPRSPSSPAGGNASDAAGVKRGGGGSRSRPSSRAPSRGAAGSIGRSKAGDARERCAEALDGVLEALGLDSGSTDQDEKPAPRPHVLRTECRVGDRWVVELCYVCANRVTERTNVVEKTVEKIVDRIVEKVVEKPVEVLRQVEKIVDRVVIQEKEVEVRVDVPTYYDEQMCSKHRCYRSVKYLTGPDDHGAYICLPRHECQCPKTADAGTQTDIRCGRCGAFGHEVQDCPRCTKCGEFGHDAEHCPRKMRRSSMRPLLCDEGHTAVRVGGGFIIGPEVPGLTGVPDLSEREARQALEAAQFAGPVPDSQPRSARPSDDVPSASAGVSVRSKPPGRSARPQSAPLHGRRAEPATPAFTGPLQPTVRRDASCEGQRSQSRGGAGHALVAPGRDNVVILSQRQANTSDPPRSERVAAAAAAATAAASSGHGSINITGDTATLVAAATAAATAGRGRSSCAVPAAQAASVSALTEAWQTRGNPPSIIAGSTSCGGALQAVRGRTVVKAEGPERDALQISPQKTVAEVRAAEASATSSGNTAHVAKQFESVEGLLRPMSPNRFKMLEEDRKQIEQASHRGRGAHMKGAPPVPHGHLVGSFIRGSQDRQRFGSTERGVRTPFRVYRSRISPADAGRAEGRRRSASTPDLRSEAPVIAHPSADRNAYSTTQAHG